MTDQLEIRRVIGLTASNGNGLASCPTTEDVAYAAGCVVVIYNAASDDQTSFLTSPKANKAIASLAYSTSGKFLAAGEVRYLSSNLELQIRAWMKQLK
jgi:hypothetical protein